MALEYNFLKQINDYVNSFRHLPTPVIICDTDFFVQWSNSAAKNRCPHLTEHSAFRELLADYDLERLLGDIAANSQPVHDVFPLRSELMCMVPLIHDGGAVAVGVIVLTRNEDDIAEAAPLYRLSQPADALSYQLRQTADQLFRETSGISDRAGAPVPEWLEPHVKHISLNSYRLLRIASNLSEYGRFWDAGGTLSTMLVNLSEWLRDIESAVVEIGRNMNIPIIFEVPEQPVLSMLDLARFEVAFFNILHNSMRFSCGNNRINIKLCQNETPAITVRDRGIGIGPQALPYLVFKPFFSSFGGAPNGLGLGLTIARQILRAHGGSISIASQEAEGTEVTMQLPRAPFSANLLLAQGADPLTQKDRFSRLYVGLLGAGLRD